MATSAKNTIITPGGTTIYLRNKDLIEEVQKSKLQGQMTDNLARMLQLLCSRYAMKHSFSGYSYNEDMQAFAMMMLIQARAWNTFDPEKGSNPFAFFTQCVHNSFIQYLKYETRERKAKDVVLISQGLNPSFAYDDEMKRDLGIEDEQDFEHITKVASATAKNQYVERVIERDDRGNEVEIEVPEEDSAPEVEATDSDDNT